MMEKLLTTEADEFERFLKTSTDPAPSLVDERQAYQYSTVSTRRGRLTIFFADADTVDVRPSIWSSARSSTPMMSICRGSPSTSRRGAASPFAKIA